MASEAITRGPKSNRWPIIYVRGFAFTEGERDQTAADPYCGFNVGSTVYRATPNKERAQSYFFESPLVRLASDFDYHVMYRDGLEIIDPAWSNGPKGSPGHTRFEEGIPLASIVIHRYYDAGSKLRGDGKTSSIGDYAKQLARLIATVRVLVRKQAQADDGDYQDKDFRCYLVAHSMGGLVVRALLENAENEVQELELAGKRQSTQVLPVRPCVLKVFTYATPHNGIELAGFNVPKVPFFLQDTRNFNRDTMRQYLDSQAIGENVNYLPSDINPPPSHWFCMIGTNRLDYEAAAGASRTFVGRGSDGLVRIDNATLWYREKRSILQADGSLASKSVELPVACAYAYRAHSGNFGIVNSEEAFQNLVRFLFGNFRVDLWLDIESATLPRDLLVQEGKRRKVDAIYQIECVVATRGKTWALSRRKSEEDSPACRTYQTIKSKKTAVEPVHLSTMFLTKGAKVNSERPGLAYSVTLGIRAPDYEVDRAFWPDGHFEGVSLFRDSLVVTIYDPADLVKLKLSRGQPVDSDTNWMVSYSWLKASGRSQGAEPPPVEREYAIQTLGELITLPVELHSDDTSDATGSMKATLRMEARAWK